MNELPFRTRDNSNELSYLNRPPCSPPFGPVLASMFSGITEPRTEHVEISKILSAVDLRAGPRQCASCLLYLERWRRCEIHGVSFDRGPCLSLKGRTAGDHGFDLGQLFIHSHRCCRTDIRPDPPHGICGDIGPVLRSLGSLAQNSPG